MKLKIGQRVKLKTYAEAVATYGGGRNDDVHPIAMPYALTDVMVKYLDDVVTIESIEDDGNEISISSNSYFWHRDIFKPLPRPMSFKSLL